MADETTQAPPASAGRPGPESDASKILAALSIVPFTSIVSVLALLLDPYKKEKFVKFHAVQGLVANIAVSLIATPLIFVLVGLILWPAWIVYSIMLAVKVYNSEYVEIPVVYGFSKQWVGED